MTSILHPAVEGAAAAAGPDERPEFVRGAGRAQLLLGLDPEAPVFENSTQLLHLNVWGEGEDGRRTEE